MSDLVPQAEGYWSKLSATEGRIKDFSNQASLYQILIMRMELAYIPIFVVVRFSMLKFGLLLTQR